MLDRFQVELDRLREKKNSPGMTAAFALPDGRVFGFASGVADKESGEPMTPDSRMLSASIGKTYVAATAISLILDGKLDLDDKIEKWLGDASWFIRLPNAADITVRNLLNHSGGITDHVHSEGFAQAVGEWKTEPDFDVTPQLHSKMVEFVCDREPLFPAGQGYQYTDTGYLLVGMIIERASGSTFYREVQHRLLDPLGLTLTSPSNRRVLPGIVPGYSAPENPFGFPEKGMVDGQLVIHPGVEWTGGGFVDNSKDLVRWARALYSGKAMKGDYLDLLFGSPNKVSDDPVCHYSLGVGIEESDFGKVCGHSGWTPYYRSRMYYYLDHGVAIAFHTNTDINDTVYEIINDLGKLVIQESI
ncbi:MAG: beta-lactamase family protein [Deltaproteobacteria bacterium]|nr:beta-lactamase family protein [Deltaproteobacteria bacterium]